MIKPVFADWTEYLSLAVKQKGMWAVYVANNLDFEIEEDNEIWSEFIKKANNMFDKNVYNIIHEVLQNGLFFFENEKDMISFFHLFTENPIESSGLYACTFDNKGVCLSENT